jgi:hypothetical protein
MLHPLLSRVRNAGVQGGVTLGGGGGLGRLIEGIPTSDGVARVAAAADFQLLGVAHVAGYDPLGILPVRATRGV